MKGYERRSRYEVLVCGQTHGPWYIIIVVVKIVAAGIGVIVLPVVGRSAVATPTPPGSIFVNAVVNAIDVFADVVAFLLNVDGIVDIYLSVGERCEQKTESE
jgi:hypothetical protein